MSMIKSMLHIVNNPWDITPSNIETIMTSPCKFWRENFEPKITDIKLWEQLYFQPGNIGIYAAWEPYAEFYMITYNLFIDQPLGIETFFGSDAQEKIIEKIEEYKIELPIWNYWNK